MIERNSKRLKSASAYFALNGPKLTRIFVLAACTCALIQGIIGASLLSVTFCLLACCAGLFAFHVLGPYSFGAWIALSFIAGNTYVALLSKTILLQPLDSYLNDADSSFLVLFVTSIGLMAAALIARRVPLGRPILGKNPQSLSAFGWACFSLGALFSILNRLAADDAEGTAFGGFASFRDLLTMAVVARTALLLERSANAKSIDLTLLFYLAAGVFFGFVENQKTYAALPVVGYFLTTTFYRRGVNSSVLVAFAGFGLVFSILLAPVVHGMRALGQQDLPLASRVEFVIDTAGSLLASPRQFEVFENLASAQFRSGNSYYSYFGEEGVGQMVLGRYASIQQIDPVVAAVNQRGEQGGDALWPALLRLLPSALYKEKPEYREEFVTLLQYGLVDPNGGKFPTVPLAAQSYAAYGMAGVVMVPFATFLTLLLAAKKLSWRLDGNVFGIFFLCQFGVAYASAGSFLQYMGFALRTFPMFGLVFFALSFLLRFSFDFRRAVGHSPAKGYR